jgi:hypothetical protein
MSNNQLLQDYFIKYDLDYTKITHRHKKLLSTDLSVYTIESKGNKTQPVVTKNNTGVTGQLELFPLFQLLHVKVNISSWSSQWTEEEIIKFLFKILKNQ